MKKEAVKKDITLQDLANMIAGTEARLSDKIDEAVDSLAQSTARGFAAVDIRFDAVEADISELKNDVSELKNDVSMLKKDVSDLKDDNKYVRGMLLETGDRYVGRSEFEHLGVRVSRLEQKHKAKR